MRYTFPILLLTTLLSTGIASAQTPYIKTLAGTGTGGFSGDGFAAAGAELNAPQGVCLDATGNIYVLDYLNYRIRKINTSGNIFTIAGTGGIGYTGDGSIGTSAELVPCGIAVDKNSNLYISDASHSVIRKVNSLGIISTFAGIGIFGYSGDGGPATSAKLGAPYGMCFDTAGNMYVADGLNNVVRKISASGVISRFAGNDTAGYSGDGGPAVNAKLDSPYAVAVDLRGNVYISDMRNNVIRKVDSAGNISTFAGTQGVFGYNGDGSAAAAAILDRPAGLATDLAGNLYFADADNDVIRMVDQSGIISTVVGNGTPGFGGDLGPVNGCNLHTPFGVAVSEMGDIYIADANNQRIRRTYNPTAVANVNGKTKIDVYPNPAANDLSVAGLEKADKLTISDVTGRTVKSATATAATHSFSLADLSAGVYTLNVHGASGNQKAVVKIVKE